MLNQIKDIVFWFRNVRKQIAFLKRNQEKMLDLPSKALDRNYIIVIEPWKINPLPMYAVTLAMLLKIRGSKVSFLIIDAKFGSNHKVQMFGIKMMIKHLRKIIPTIYLKDSLQAGDIAPTGLKVEAFTQLAFANAVHFSRGEDSSVEFKNLIDKYYNLYLQNYASIESFMDLNRSSYYIVPGGIYGFSGIVLDYAKKIGVKHYTYDSGFGVLLTSITSVAAHCKDIPIALDLVLRENDLGEMSFAIEQAEIELQKRVNGKDVSKTQVQSYEDSLSFDEVGVLIPLNSPWDSATLRIDYLFRGYKDWLLQTVDLVLKNSLHKVTIRQHPDERHWYGKSNLNFGNILKEIYGNEPRIQYIACTDKVNTYALTDKAKLVICFSSTFGIEAALRNKKVIVCSNVYYSNFNFVTKPRTKEDLAKLIYEFKSFPGLNADERKIAKLCFYLGQKCNWLYSNFTPTSSDFDKWVEMDLEYLIKESSVEILLESIEKNIPVSYINHKRNNSRAKFNN